MRMFFFKLKIEYEGTNFVGWQYQPNGRSVQEELEKALARITQLNVKVIGAGRTDAGVHARGQVASFCIDKDIKIETLARSLNGILPDDIVVKEALRAPQGFNARYDAKSRIYKYYIKQEPTALDRNFCWQVFYNLDSKKMTMCAEKIKGEHDFKSFCKSNGEDKDTRCVVYSAEWSIKGTDMVFTINANRFLYGMVRALVGTMVDVGRGYTSYDEFMKILEARDRSFAGQSAPAKGLFLEEIVY